MTASDQVTVTVTTSRAVTEIGKAWHKTIDALLETATLLHSYSQQANWREIKERLQVDGLMGASVVSMMLSIGRDRRLQKPAVKKLLPPSYNTLYLLSKLNDDVIDAKVKEEALTPALTLQEVRDWSKQVSTRNSSISTNSTGGKLVLCLPDKFGARDRSRLLKDLKTVVANYPGVEVSST